MNKTSISVLALVVGMIIGAMLSGVTMNKGGLGGVTIENETFKGDVTVEGTIAGSGDITVGDDLTVSGGIVDITSANTATSSVTVGCIDGYATSTATAVKFVLGKVGSSATSTLYNTSSGAVYWAYGSCN